MRSFLVLLLVACTKPPVKPVPKPEPVTPISERMDAFEMNGYVLAGAEYYPYVGADPVKYPNDVLWGFYPEKGQIPPGETTPNVDSASPAAIDCAKQAFAELQVFLAHDSPALRAIVDQGEAQGFVPRFYLWMNDYSRAASPYPRGVREARLWYWKRKAPEAGKPPGYWKWESTLTQDGECHVPRPAQIESYLTETLSSMKSRVSRR